jgi:GH15 family glucan-1,4-alpha-glucosidase
MELTSQLDNLDYGVIGNGKTAALVSRFGSIDWCCLPDFDSSSIFAKILDTERGGFFAIEGVGEDYRITQNYINRTNILRTQYSNGQDAFEVLDFMPRYHLERHIYHCPPDIIRFVRRLSGSPKIRALYHPRPAYARSPVDTHFTSEFVKTMTTHHTYESIYLYSNLPLREIVESKSIELPEEAYFLVSYNQKLNPLSVQWAELEFERTKVYWMGWIAKTTLVTKYPKEVERSALVLKMLAHQKTGAILAAVTTSLPETIGEQRNWDYRYCWIRDASMTINILTKMGHYNVAKRFLQFILDIVPYKDDAIQIMYGINPRRKLTERSLPWLRGYEGSTPVRVGNAAAVQKQHDIFGVLLDVIFESLTLFSNSIDNKEELWTVVRSLTRHVSKNWRRLDSGIWEYRSGLRHFTFSKILCWVAMDRAAKIAMFFKKTPDAMSYLSLRDKIKADILKKGRHPETGALTQVYGGTSMDAANLLAETYGFLKADDPVFVSTAQETYKHLCVDGLMYRYREEDDFGKPKSSFTVCTFWMIRSLYKIGQRELAEKMFEDLLKCSNHLGLFSEDLDFQSKRLLGNFPQGYSHIALIDTASILSDTPAWTGNSEDICSRLLENSSESAAVD